MAVVQVKKSQLVKHHIIVCIPDTGIHRIEEIQHRTELKSFELYYLRIRYGYCHVCWVLLYRASFQMEGHPGLFQKSAFLSTQTCRPRSQSTLLTVISQYERIDSRSHIKWDFRMHRVSH